MTLGYSVAELDAYALQWGAAAAIPAGRVWDTWYGEDLARLRLRPAIPSLVNPDGGRVWDTWYGRWASWRPIGPVVDSWRVVDAVAELTLGGVVGNTGHWNRPDGGDHTSRSTHGITINGVYTLPAPGWVYAIDVGATDTVLAAARDWILTEVFLGRLPELKYFNVLGKHYHRARGWMPVDSGDHHLHLSIMPGWETRHSSLLADFWAHHTGQATTEDDMDATQAAQLSEVHNLLHNGLRNGPNQTSGGGVPIAWIVRQHDALVAANAADATRDAALQAAIDALAPADVDTQAVIDAVNSQAEQTRAAILAQAATDADAVVAELAQRLSNNPPDTA